MLLYISIAMIFTVFLIYSIFSRNLHCLLYHAQSKVFFAFPDDAVELKVTGLNRIIYLKICWLQNQSSHAKPIVTDLALVYMRTLHVTHKPASVVVATAVSERFPQMMFPSSVAARILI